MWSVEACVDALSNDEVTDIVETIDALQTDVNSSVSPRSYSSCCGSRMVPISKMLALSPGRSVAKASSMMAVPVLRPHECCGRFYSLHWTGSARASGQEAAKRASVFRNATGHPMQVPISWRCISGLQRIISAPRELFDGPGRVIRKAA